LFLLLACCIARSQTINPAANESIQSKLDFQVEHLKSQNYRATAPEIDDHITADKRKSFPIQLVAGVVNAIIATCGTNCDHVEISLYDYQRKLLGRSPEKQHTVILNGKPSQSGLHEVEIAVPGCHASECEVGLVVLRQPDDRNPVSDPVLLTEIRNRLYELNFDPGPLDGKGDDELTKRAIAEFEAANKMARVGHPTAELLQRLRAAGALNPWGAIMKGGDKWGMSWGHTTRKAAVAAARLPCGTSCTTEVSFFGTECGAFANSDSSWAITARQSMQQAKETALSDCGKRGRSCRIVAAVCADGGDRTAAR
jgi:hypothetical protein